MYELASQGQLDMNALRLVSKWRFIKREICIQNSTKISQLLSVFQWQWLNVSRLLGPTISVSVLSCKTFMTKEHLAVIIDAVYQFVNCAEISRGKLNVQLWVMHMNDMFLYDNTKWEYIEIEKQWSNDWSLCNSEEVLLCADSRLKHKSSCTLNTRNTNEGQEQPN